MNTKNTILSNTQPQRELDNTKQAHKANSTRRWANISLSSVMAVFYVTISCLSLFTTILYATYIDRGSKSKNWFLKLLFEDLIFGSDRNTILFSTLAVIFVLSFPIIASGVLYYFREKNLLENKDIFNATTIMNSRYVSSIRSLCSVVVKKNFSFTCGAMFIIMLTDTICNKTFAIPFNDTKNADLVFRIKIALREIGVISLNSIYIALAVEAFLLLCSMLYFVVSMLMRGNVSHRLKMNINEKKIEKPKTPGVFDWWILESVLFHAIPLIALISYLTIIVLKLVPRIIVQLLPIVTLSYEKEVSLMAMCIVISAVFIRAFNGSFTKFADISADFNVHINNNFSGEEDDLNNPMTFFDNLGDIVGDGFGYILFAIVAVSTAYVATKNDKYKNLREILWSIAPIASQENIMQLNTNLTQESTLKIFGLTYNNWKLEMMKKYSQHPIPSEKFDRVLYMFHSLNSTLSIFESVVLLAFLLYLFTFIYQLYFIPKNDNKLTRTKIRIEISIKNTLKYLVTAITPKFVFSILFGVFFLWKTAGNFSLVPDEMHGVKLKIPYPGSPFLSINVLSLSISAAFVIFTLVFSCLVSKELSNVGLLVVTRSKTVNTAIRKIKFSFTSLVFLMFLIITLCVPRDGKVYLNFYPILFISLSLSYVFSIIDGFSTDITYTLNMLNNIDHRMLSQTSQETFSSQDGTNYSNIQLQKDYFKMFSSRFNKLDTIGNGFVGATKLIMSFYMVFNYVIGEWALIDPRNALSLPSFLELFIMVVIPSIMTTITRNRLKQFTHIAKTFSIPKYDDKDKQHSYILSVMHSACSDNARFFLICILIIKVIGILDTSNEVFLLIIMFYQLSAATNGTTGAYFDNIKKYYKNDNAFYYDEMKKNGCIPKKRIISLVEDTITSFMATAVSMPIISRTINYYAVSKGIQRNDSLLSVLMQSVILTVIWTFIKKVWEYINTHFEFEYKGIFPIIVVNNDVNKKKVVAVDLHGDVIKDILSPVFLLFA